MSWRFASWIGVIAAVCLGGPVASAQSPEPIDLPDPKRMLLSARQVITGELIIFDPVAVKFGATRPMPDAVTLPRPRRVGLRARMGSVYIALPLHKQAIVSVRMDSIDIAVPDPVPIGVALRITEAELKMPETRRARAAAWRHAPEIVLIIEPLAMTAVIQRHVYEADVYRQLVQSFLKDRGYDPGPVDGLIGKRTRSAIASFKADMASSGAFSDADRGLLELIEGLPK